VFSSMRGAPIGQVRGQLATGRHAWRVGLWPVGKKFVLVIYPKWGTRDLDGWYLVAEKSQQPRLMNAAAAVALALTLSPRVLIEAWIPREGGTFRSAKRN